MDLTINWLAENWRAFSLWSSTQPTFLQVALGMGLFYVALQLFRLLYRAAYFTLSGLFAGRGRTRAKKGVKAPSPTKKHISMDEDAPPFVFR